MTDLVMPSLAVRTGKVIPSGPMSLSQVIGEVEQQVNTGAAERLRPLATGFNPLDDVLNGGVRPGELVIVGGPFGVGKTILGLQLARNVVRNDPSTWALYVCFEHDRTHLLSRLLCLESAECNHKDDALTMRRLNDILLEAVANSASTAGGGVISRLRRIPRYATALQALEVYAERLVVVKASGEYTTLKQIRHWALETADAANGRLLIVVDYLQKIPLEQEAASTEAETTTYLTQGLKEMAMSLGIPVVSIAAADRQGLKGKRMRLSDLRGSSALQYEADIGLVLNNKYAILSREHMVYNITQAEAMRNWVVLTVEKNRAGRAAIDMEYALDAAHFRFEPRGGFVRERLIDEKVVLE